MKIYPNLVQLAVVGRQVASQPSRIASRAGNFPLAGLALACSIGQLVKISPEQTLVCSLHGMLLMTEVSVTLA